MADSQRKTENLFDGDVEQGTWNAIITPIVKADSSVRCRVSNFIDVAENTQYTISLVNAISGLQIIVVFVDDNYSRLSETTWLSLPITFNTPTNCKYVEAIFRKSDNTNIIPSECGNLMLNTGSSALPYEPYGWVHSLRKLTTATETIQSGDTIYADGTAATVNLKGNTTQSGTPSPSNPVDVNGVGERTENLWNESYTGIKIDVITYKPLNVGDGDYTLSSTVTVEGQAAVLFLLAGNVSSGATTANNGVWNGQSRTVTAVNGYVTIGYRKYTEANPENANTMLNSGSTAKPYEPYGYKIPILNNSTTTPIYLGSTQSSRLIEKVVLTGEEEWQNNFGISLFGTRLSNTTITGITALSSHYTYNPIQSGLNNGLPNGEFALQTSSPPTALYIKDESYTTVETWKTYLAAQYSAGNPVTVWYVLATPRTTTVNEPLMKIGTYADSISGVSLPTTDGANAITIDTTVQPSEVTAGFSGWHPVSAAHERENGQWD